MMLRALCEVPSWHGSSAIRLLGSLIGTRQLGVEFIQPLQRQVEQEVLVLPPHFTLDEAVIFPWRRRWLRDLGD